MAFIEHLNLTVSDIDRSVAFYGRLFGFRIRWQGASSDGSRAVHLGDDRCFLAMFEAATSGRFTKDYDTVGPNHLGFVVDDLDAMRDRLRSLGVDPHHEAGYEPGRRLYFRDPDGIEIELVEYAKGEEPWANEATITAVL